MYSSVVLKSRWPMLLTGIAWFTLAVLTLLNTNQTRLSFLENPIWWIVPIFISGLTISLWAYGGHKLRWLTTFLTIWYALARGFSYVLEHIWAPLGVWFIIIALTLLAYKGGERRGYL